MDLAQCWGIGVRFGEDSGEDLDRFFGRNERRKIENGRNAKWGAERVPSRHLHILHNTRISHHHLPEPIQPLFTSRSIRRDAASSALLRRPRPLNPRILDLGPVLRSSRRESSSPPPLIQQQPPLHQQLRLDTIPQFRPSPAAHPRRCRDRLVD